MKGTSWWCFLNVCRLLKLSSLDSDQVEAESMGYIIVGFIWFSYKLMQSSKGLLEALIWLWRPMEGAFEMYDQCIQLEREYIYFLKCLSTRLIKEETHPSLGGMRMINQMVDWYCGGCATGKQDHTIVILKIVGLLVQAIASIVNQVLGAKTSHYI